MQELLIPHEHILDCSQLVAPSCIPSTRLSYQFGEVYIYSLFISGPVFNQHLNYALTFLSQSERLRYSSYEDYYQGISFLFGRLLAKRGIAQQSGCHFSKISINKYGPFGKPISSDAFFNLTRSGPFIVCAVSTTHDVGVDIEITNTDIDIMSISEYLRDSSFDFKLSFSDDCSSHFSFYKNWTRFEAISKLVGTGLIANRGVSICSCDYLLTFEHLHLTGHLCAQLKT